jgi:hypothetical protein
LKNELNDRLQARSKNEALWFNPLAFYHAKENLFRSNLKKWKLSFACIQGNQRKYVLEGW